MGKQDEPDGHCLTSTWA